jgi:16S rRNA (adenine1518-N6/adenine1519-N6)-dimethyltransferase
MADALEAAPDEVVLEIGPGGGTLTRELVDRGLRVVAIEKDRGLAQRLEAGAQGAGSGSLRVVAGDALRLDWHALIGASGDPAPRSPVPTFVVVGNIPYAITTPLIEQALVPPLPRRVVFLVQREVAERLAAAPGARAYGALSVGVQAVCRVERLFAVRAGAFRPPPRVQSAVVRLTPLATPLVAPAEQPALRAFVAACFSGRRKQLRNAVARATGLPAQVVAAGVTGLGLDPAARPETLPPVDFLRLLRWSRSL